MRPRFHIIATFVLGVLAALPCAAQNKHVEIGMGVQSSPPNVAQGKAAAETPAVAKPKPHSQEIALAERALKESYALGKELPAEARIQHLMSLCSGAADVESLATQRREWTEELYRLAGELPSSDQLRSRAQSMAVALMAAVDAKRALQLFDMLEAPARAELDPRPWVARATFSKILEQQGVKAIPELRARARKLGESGAYPYSAMVPVLVKLKNQPEKAAQVFADALYYYRQGKDPFAGEMNFISFLRGAYSVRVIPDWLMHEAAQELATDVAREVENSSEAETPGGFHRSDFYFRAAYFVLQNIDPEVANSLKAQEPSTMRSSAGGGMMMGAGGQQQQQSANRTAYRDDPEFQRLGVRTDELVRTIMAMSEDGQERSPEMQSAIAQAMASGVKQTERALELDADDGHAIRLNPPALGGVINAASKIAPEMTLDEIELAQDTELRAYLLIRFASGIRELQFIREMEKTDEATPVVESK